MPISWHQLPLVEGQNPVAQFADVVGSDLQVAQAGQVGDQDVEARPGQAGGEGDQPRVILAPFGGPGDQQNGPQGGILGLVEVGLIATTLDLISMGRTRRGRRQLFAATRPVLGGDIGQQEGGVVVTNRRAAGCQEDQQASQPETTC